MKTREEILLCDHCGKPIVDINMSMVFWSEGGGTVVGRVRLAHKVTCDDDKLNRSIELAWLQEDGLHELARLVSDYVWSAEQLQRLIEIAWALSPEVDD